MPLELMHASRKLYYEAVNVRGVGSLHHKHTESKEVGIRKFPVWSDGNSLFNTASSLAASGIPDIYYLLFYRCVH